MHTPRTQILGRVGLRYAIQVVFLYLLFVVGSALSDLLALPLPGSLVGLLLLLLLLYLGVIRPADVQETAAIVVQHLNFFFIPLVVGLMAWRGLFATRGLALAVSLVASVAIGLVAAGLVAQRLSSRGAPDAAS
jgi:holin-like protein